MCKLWKSTLIIVFITATALTAHRSAAKLAGSPPLPWRFPGRGNSMHRARPSTPRSPPRGLAAHFVHDYPISREKHRMRISIQGRQSPFSYLPFKQTRMPT